jgi:hypothetical protein
MSIQLCKYLGEVGTSEMVVWILWYGKGVRNSKNLNINYKNSSNVKSKKSKKFRKKNKILEKTWKNMKDSEAHEKKTQFKIGSHFLNGYTVYSL